MGPDTVKMLRIWTVNEILTWYRNIRKPDIQFSGRNFRVTRNFNFEKWETLLWNNFLSFQNRGNVKMLKWQPYLLFILNSL